MKKKTSAPLKRLKHHVSGAIERGEAKPITAVVFDKMAVYIGRRLNGGKIHHVFMKPDGEKMFFQNVRMMWIGYTYKCGDDKIAIRPERVDVPVIDCPEWEAEDALIDVYNSKARAEKKIAAMQKPTLKKAIEALRPLCANLTHYEYRELIEHLVGTLQDERNKSRRPTNAKEALKKLRGMK